MGKWQKKVNKETFFRGLRRFLFLRNFIVQPCVCVCDSSRYLIFSVIIKKNSSLESQAKSLVCFSTGAEFLLSLLIDNKSVSFLIKCPTPVIELQRRRRRKRREREKWIFTLKSERKTKERHNVGNIFGTFFSLAKSMLFVWGTQTFHLLRSSRPMCLLVPPAPTSNRRILQVNCVARGLMTLVERKQTC